MKSERCIIKTPQFVGSKISRYHVQEGEIDKSTWVFEPYSYHNGNHKVMFGDRKTFEKFTVKTDKA